MLFFLKVYLQFAHFLCKHVCLMKNSLFFSHSINLINNCITVQRCLPITHACTQYLSCAHRRAHVVLVKFDDAEKSTRATKISPNPNFAMWKSRQICNIRRDNNCSGNNVIESFAVILARRQIYNENYVRYWFERNLYIKLIFIYWVCIPILLWFF